MNVYLKLISLAMLVLVLSGIVLLGFSIAEIYMVGTGQIAPGEQIYVDQVALPLSEIVREVFIGTLLLIVGFGVRLHIRRKVESSPHNTSVNTDAPSTARPLL